MLNKDGNTLAGGRGLVIRGLKHFHIPALDTEHSDLNSTWNADWVTLDKVDSMLEAPDS